MPKKPENAYTLTGIVVHSGQANGGHYYSFIRQASADGLKHQWLRFDDAEVN
jgi:ubiquitin carboxyl-terminal hydrolase 9/24